MKLPKFDFSIVIGFNLLLFFAYLYLFTYILFPGEFSNCASPIFHVGLLIMTVLSLILTLKTLAHQVGIRKLVLATSCFFIVALAFLQYLASGPYCSHGALREMVEFQVGMQCSSWRLDASENNIRLTIINAYDQETTITNATCQNQGTNGPWTQYSPSIQILPQNSAKLTIDNLYDSDGNKMKFEEGDVFNGKCALEFYFTSEGPSKIRRNIADVKFTAQP